MTEASYTGLPFYLKGNAGHPSAPSAHRYDAATDQQGRAGPMGSTSSAAHGSHRSTIRSPIPLRAPRVAALHSRGWGSVTPIALAALFLSSPHWPGAPDKARSERAVPDRTGLPAGPPAHLLGRLDAAPPPRPGARQVPQRQDAHLHLQREKALLARLLRGGAPVPGGAARGCVPGQGGNDGGKDGGNGGGGRLGGLRALTSAGAGARGGRAALPLPPGALRHRFTIRPIRRGRRGAPAALPANQRAGGRRAASGARDGAPARAEPFRSFSWRSPPSPSRALPAATAAPGGKGPAVPVPGEPPASFPEPLPPSLNLGAGRKGRVSGCRLGRPATGS